MDSSQLGYPFCSPCVCLFFSHSLSFLFLSLSTSISKGLSLIPYFVPITYFSPHLVVSFWKLSSSWPSCLLSPIIFQGHLLGLGCLRSEAHSRSRPSLHKEQCSPAPSSHGLLTKKLKLEWDSEWQIQPIIILIFHFSMMENRSRKLTSLKWKWKSLSRVWLFATPRTIRSMEFSRPEYWGG